MLDKVYQYFNDLDNNLQSSKDSVEAFQSCKQRYLSQVSKDKCW